MKRQSMEAYMQSIKTKYSVNHYFHTWFEVYIVNDDDFQILSSLQISLHRRFIQTYYMKIYSLEYSTDTTLAENYLL